MIIAIIITKTPESKDELIVTVLCNPPISLPKPSLNFDLLVHVAPPLTLLALKFRDSQLSRPRPGLSAASITSLNTTTDKKKSHYIIIITIITNTTITIIIRTL